MRAFLAVPVAGPAHEPVTELIGRLRQRVGGVRWVDPATVHLTLHFFADLARERVGEVIEAIRPLVVATPAFPLSLGGLGSFPSGSRSRVLWLGLTQESPPLAALAGGIAAILGRSGFEIESRPYRAHLTLGRPKPVFDARAWRAELTAPPPILPTFTAAEVLLYESAGGHHVRARLALR